MRKIKAKQFSRIQHRVPNNPAYDRQTIDPEEVAAENDAINRTLYDSSYKTARGHWKRSDEPDEAEQLRQSDRIQQILRTQRQKASRERLKQKPGGVPVRPDGKKLFNEYMREAYSRRPPQAVKKKMSKDLEVLRNLYNAASVLEFDEWVLFVTNDLGNG
jgi:hypothetical protein